MGLFAFFIAAGMLLLFGTFRRWRWLVDPPEELWFCYTQSFLKGLLGPSGLVKFTYGLGALFVVVGGYGLILYAL